MKGKIELSELDAKLMAMRSEITTTTMLVLGIVVMLVTDGGYAVFTGFSAICTNIAAALMIVLAIVMLIISLFCGKDFMKFLNIVNWPRKYTLK